MNSIYLYDGYFEKGDRGWPLVRQAAASYGEETGLDYDFMTAKMERTDKGKPYFVDCPVAFSLSHSGLMWMCMFSAQPCGLDLQLVEPERKRETIVKRRYTKEEQHYVDLWGVEGFYEIWVRKEAFGKCTGLGIFSDMPSMVNEQHDLQDQLEWEGLQYYMTSITISPEMKCAACTMGEEPIELRILG